MMNVERSFFLIAIVAATVLYGGDGSPGRYSVEAGMSARLLKNRLTGDVSFFTFGIHGSFPVQSDRISVRFGAEYGHRALKGTYRETGIILSEIALSYTIFFYQDKFSVSPSLFLENCALHLQPAGNMNDVIIIAAWENEFGSGIGCDITARCGSFTFSIPVSVAILFTHKSASIFSTGVKLGITLRGRNGGLP